MISDEQLKDLVLRSGDAKWLTTTKEMAQELLQRREAEQKNLMCWRKDYPEEGGICDDSLAETIADELAQDEETTEEVQVAVSLPDRKMRVWLTGGEDREVHWGWVK